MEQSTRRLRVMSVAMILALCAAVTFSNQEATELDSTARARIEQARSSIVIVKAVDESNKTISEARGFFIRKDLVATDNEIVNTNSRLRLTSASQQPMRVVSSGNYFLPYVLVETQAEVSPLSLGESERVAVNDSVYMLSDAGEIAAGRVIGTTTIKNTQTFLISLPVDSNNKGAPVFNRYGEVIGIAAKSPDGQSAGFVWPSHLLATLKHLNEPGVGVGSGDGPRFPIGPTATTTATPSVDTKPVRLSTPNPGYTEAARLHGIQGSVVLRVLVAEDGRVNAISVVRGLPDGLTEQAIAAARLTKFKPAMKDGKPVPHWVVLELTFNLR
jgi:TonB family protein